MTPTNPGEVTIKLGNKSIVLRHTPRAVKLINSLGPGLTPVMQSVTNNDFSVITQVICMASGKTSGDEYDEMEEAVFSNGVLPLVGPLSEYILMLANGGKSSSGDDKGDKETKKGNPASS